MEVLGVMAVRAQGSPLGGKEKQRLEKGDMHEANRKSANPEEAEASVCEKPGTDEGDLWVEW